MMKKSVMSTDKLTHSDNQTIILTYRDVCKNR